jgi:hypothetical protein
MIDICLWIVFMFVYFITKIGIDSISFLLQKVVEENVNMVITNGNDGNKFTIPDCKLISVDKTGTKNLIVHILYQEAGRYKIVE